MNSKKIILFSMCLALIVSLGACGAKDTVATTPEPVVETEAPVTSVSGVMTAEEVEALAENTYLQSADLSGSTCYEAILAFIEAHPDVEVKYTVGIGGSDVDPKTAKLDLEANAFELSTLCAVAQYLPDVTEISLDGDKLTIDGIKSVKDAYPNAEVSYTVTVCGDKVNSDTQSLDLSDKSAQDIDDSLEALSKLELLRYINVSKQRQITDAFGQTVTESYSNLSLDDVKKLANAAPKAGIDYTIELFGKQVSLSSESLEYVETQIGNEGVSQIRDALKLMNACTYVKLDDCSIDNTVLAELRDEFPDKKIAWRIHFCGYDYMTDSERIWATGRVTDGFTGVLNYCTDVKYLDLGHNCITNIDFVRNMPKLEVLVCSITWVESVEPLASCPELEYLEIFNSHVTDLSPLANCTKLEHINCGYLDKMTDISPLYGLTNLKRFRCTVNVVPIEQQEEIQKLMPNCEFCFKYEDPAGGDWRTDENGDYVERYALLREQMGYDDQELLAMQFQ